MKQDCLMGRALPPGALPPSELRSDSPAGSSYSTPPRIHATHHSSLATRYSLLGFTLIEVSISVMILALLAAAALRYAEATAYANNVATTNANLDAVENALISFRYMYGRLPCPASLTDGTGTSTDPGIENNHNFGIEAATPGTCTGGTPAANYQNGIASTDPDYGESQNDTATAQMVVGGGIPTKTLQLADKYAYDAWGRRILYVVDKRITSTNAFSIYPVSTSTSSSSGSSSVGAVVVKRNKSDTLSQAITYKGIYALVSFGANGHGGYVRNITVTTPVTTPKIYNFGSTNTDELQNCHCNSSAVVGTFDRDFVQKAKTTGSTYSSGTLTDQFDDIVRYKTRGDMEAYSEMQ